jgi:hypothetical protein
MFQILQFEKWCYIIEHQIYKRINTLVEVLIQ